MLPSCIVATSTSIQSSNLLFSSLLLSVWLDIRDLLRKVISDHLSLRLESDFDGPSSHSSKIQNSFLPGVEGIHDDNEDVKVEEEKVRERMPLHLLQVQNQIIIHGT